MYYPLEQHSDVINYHKDWSQVIAELLKISVDSIDLPYLKRRGGGRHQLKYNDSQI